jgi:uncharacterized membrane protein
MLLVILLSVVPVWAFLFPAAPWGHNGDYHPFRVLAAADAFRAGIFPPRWCPSLGGGLGYSIFNYYGWASYAVGAILHLAGLGAIASANAVFVLSGILLGIGAYSLGREMAGRRGGWVCFALYAFAPYQMVNLYVRGNLPEYAAGALAPWALLGAVRTVRGRGAAGPALVAVALGLMIFTHNISAMVFFPLILGLGAAWARSAAGSWAAARPVLKRLGAAGTMAVLLSAHFWIPVGTGTGLVQLDWVTGSYYDYSVHFLYAHQLLARTWSFGFSRAGIPDSMSFQLGPGQVLVIVLGLLLGARGRVRRPLRRAVWLPLGTALFVCFLMTYYSTPFWMVFPPLGLLQFPWRLLLPANLLLAVAGSLLVAWYLPSMHWFDFRRAPRRVRRCAPWVYALASAACSLPYCVPKEWMELTDNALRAQMTDEYITTACVDEYRPRWVKMPQVQNVTSETLRGLRGGAATLSADTTPNHLVANVAATSTTVLFPAFYYPGWTVRVDGRPAKAEPAPGSGMVMARIPAGSRRVEASRRQTWIESVSDAISVGAAAFGIVWLAGAVLRRRRTAAN